MMRSKSRRILIRDCDCLTPLGNAAGTHLAMLEGRTALRAAPAMGKLGGDPVPLALLPDHHLDEEVPPRWIESLTRFLEPVRGAGWGTARKPVCFSSSNFGIGSLLAHRIHGGDGHLNYGTPECCVARISEAMAWGRNRATFSHACVSAHLALLHAERLVASGSADEVLVVSFDFLSPFVAGGFNALKILNGVFPAPFQAREVGSIGLGDGAAYAVIGSREGDLEIVAQSLHNEMFHFTGNTPDGSGFIEALKPLTGDGRRLWLKGHGTGTLEPARSEAAAFASLFPGSPLVGWKGALGHTLGSCGLVELAIAAVALSEGTTPGTVGSSAPTVCDNVAIEAFDNRGFDGVVCASNAFGGAHAALTLSHA